jgi:DNA-directed RNA polymerase specialized sigma subunit
MKKRKSISNNQEYDNSLRLLAKEVTAVLNFNKDGSDQKAQVELVMKLEESFRKSIITFAQSREIYKQFILLVAVKNKQILSARPYFREKSKVFSSQITPAIKNGDIKKLQTFHINYNLIKFIRENWKGPFPERSEKIYQKFVDARRKLIENNLPLAINRAKLFYRKVPRSHLSLMDMIGIASMGLVSGVDKWVGEYSRVFNSVCIGRMTGNMIDSYSETTLHFYPSDSSILYRANSLRFKYDIQDLNELAEAINKSYVEDQKNGVKVPKQKITADQLSNLLNAASVLSIDAPAPSSSDGKETIYSYLEGTPDGSDTPEDSLIKQDLVSKLIDAIRKLPILQQKVIRLKGVKL